MYWKKKEFVKKNGDQKREIRHLKISLIWKEKQLNVGVHHSQN